MGIMSLFFVYLMVLMIVGSNAGLHPAIEVPNRLQDVHEESPSTPALTTVLQEPKLAYPKNRKLMANGVCTNRDISISQSKDSSSGIPQYVVQIVNTCLSGCAPSNIHLHCGWFASARIVNPRTFKRLSFDDCLVNGGRPLRTSQTIRFTYSNSFMYPLVFKSARFC